MEQNTGYTIIKAECVGKNEIVLGYNPKAPEPYVTWKRDAKTKDAHWGHYFSDKNKAIKDFEKRVKNEKEYER